MTLQSILRCLPILALVFSYAATAFDPTNPATPAEIVLHHAGSSSSSTTFLNTVRSLCVADADLYVDNGNAVNGTDALDVANEFNGSYWAMACEVDLGAGNQRLLYYKRDAGGSAVGVFPVAAQSTVAFMGIDATNCPSLGSGTINFHICSGYSDGLGNTSLHEMAPPSFGTSDVEHEIISTPENNPAGFVDFNNDGDFSDATPPADLSLLAPEGVGLLTFGVAANTRMYTGLQFDQFEATSVCHPQHSNYGDIEDITSNANSEACTPTMTRASVGALMTSGRTVDTIEEIADVTTMPADTSDGDPSDDVTATDVKPLENLTDTTPAGAHKIQVCRRNNGSGAQAQQSLFYFNYPCDANQKDNSFNINVPESALDLGFFENGVKVANTGSEVAECLSSYNQGTNEGNANPNPSNRVRWAIGFQPLTRTDSYSKQYRFVKIDGYAPTLENVQAGRYTQWFRQTLYRAPSGLSSDQTAVIALLVAAQRNPAILAAANVTHGFGIGGWLAEPGSLNSASPTNPNNLPSSSLDAAAPIGRYERKDNLGKANSCVIPSAFDEDGVGIQLK